MEKKIYRPKTYTHVDYEALVIYAMKHRVSIEQAICDNNIEIARSTIVRNIKKLADNQNTTINLYQNGYVPNMQKKELPSDIKIKIEKLDFRPIIKGNELDDIYMKLTTMKEIINACNGNASEAARKINSGKTPLGKIKPITVQGLLKDMKYLEKVKDQLEIERTKNRQENNENDLMKEGK